MRRSLPVGLTVLLAALVGAGVSPIAPAAAATVTVDARVALPGDVADDDAFVIVEQRLPAGARGAVFDAADGYWYSAYSDLVDPAGSGHYPVQLEPGTYRFTAIDEDADDNPLAYETVVSVTGNQPLAMSLGAATDCDGQPAVQGATGRVGDPLSAVSARFTPSDAGGAVTYQWYRQDPNDPNEASAYTRIDGARSSVYTPTTADVGHRIAVDVSLLSDHGYVTCTSTDSGTIFPALTIYKAANPAHLAPGQSRPVGSARVGKRLRAPSLAGVPATATLTYQWFRRHPGAQPIHGARSSTYRLHRADRGTRVYVVVSVTDASYLFKSIRSDTVRVR